MNRDVFAIYHHRGIALLYIPGKLFTRILSFRALPVIRSSLSDSVGWPSAELLHNRPHLHWSSPDVEEHHLYIGFIDTCAVLYRGVSYRPLEHHLRSSPCSSCSTSMPKAVSVLMAGTLTGSPSSWLFHFS